MATINTNDLLNTTEAAGMLDLSNDTVKKYCQSGVLSALKLGRSWMLDKKEIERYLKERNAVGRPPKNTG